MSLHAIASVASNDDIQLNAAIVSQCRLSETDVATIAQAQRVLGLRFVDTALRLGFITQNDIDQALSSGRMHLPAVTTAIPGNELILAHDIYDPRSERIQALCTELLLRHEDIGSANVLAVLSPCSGEGRSQLAAELAIAFAQLGRPTLLVDADLRRPNQHRLFGTDNHRGLSQAIASGETPRCHPVAGLANMHLLTSGPLPANPMELLSGVRFESMIDDWRHSYDFVVLDTAPVRRYSDGLAVATVVGRVLMVSRAKHTSYKDTRDMLRRLSATQSRILGAVINHF
ncbi:MAG: CpsD/CapB family tyrosine-protein kinase [Dokdonella sp.]